MGMMMMIVMQSKATTPGLKGGEARGGCVPGHGKLPWSELDRAHGKGSAWPFGLASMAICRPAPRWEGAWLLQLLVGLEAK